MLRLTTSERAWLHCVPAGSGRAASGRGGPHVALWLQGPWRCAFGERRGRAARRQDRGRSLEAILAGDRVRVGGDHGHRALDSCLHREGMAGTQGEGISLSASGRARLRYRCCESRPRIRRVEAGPPGRYGPPSFSQGRDSSRGFGVSGVLRDPARRQSRLVRAGRRGGESRGGPAGCLGNTSSSSGDIEQRWATYLGASMDERLAADYDTAANFTAEDARQECERARAFVERIRHYLLLSGLPDADLGTSPSDG